MNTNDQRTQIEAALKAAGEAAESARLMRAAAIAEIGEILRRDRAAGDLVGIVWAESLTGLSRPTLTEARRDTAAWQELTDLAAAALTDEVAEEELHSRLPVLAAWERAADHINSIAAEASFREHGPMGPLVVIPQTDQLMAVHRASIERLAAGRPTGFDVDRIDLPELTRRLGEPDHNQQAVLSWTGCDEGTTWTEAEAAELAEVWQADTERIAAAAG